MTETPPTDLPPKIGDKKVDGPFDSENSPMARIIEYSTKNKVKLTVSFKAEEKEYLIEIYDPETSMVMLALIDMGISSNFRYQCQQLLNSSQDKIYMVDGMKGSANIIRIDRSETAGFIRLNIVKDFNNHSEQTPADQMTIEVPEAEFAKIVDCWPE